MPRRPAGPGLGELGAERYARDASANPSACPDSSSEAPSGAEAERRRRSRAVAARRRRLNLLVDLLSDDSEAVTRGVAQELQRSGRAATPALKRATRSPNARLRTRARQLLNAGRREIAVRRLARFACREEIDLERGLFLLAKLDRPAFDSRPYTRALDAMAKEVAARAAREPDDFARPMVLSQYLGDELGFIGAESDFDHPDHIHVHRCIERKRGMPLTLTAIYLFVARRAGLRVAAVALPGRVFLRLYSGRRYMLVDPFEGGRARTRKDCIRYLSEHGLVPRPGWFHDASDAKLFQRHVLNLMNSYQVRGHTRLARRLYAIARTVGQVHEGVAARD